MEWKVFKDKEAVGPVAECVHAEDAACLIALYGEGALIKRYGNVVWREGAEDFAAEESYDQVAAICHRRAEEKVSV